ncbi:MAG: pilus assembly protein FimV [Glaciimonas sp.]|nr:pilus assembly protein FimV [Glaciimonas sp.]
MMNSPIPNMTGVPTDAMANSVDFIKKMWGNIGVPGMVVPTLSVEEINKKITDLKAVEGWLGMNLNMLRTTIQALEVQNATLSALQAMGAVAAPDGQASAKEHAGAFPWAAMTSAFPFAQPAAEVSSAKQAASASPPVASSVEQPASTAANTEGETQEKMAANANVWWDLLQNQFKQVVGNVVAADKAMDAAAKTEVKTKPVQKNVVKAAPKAKSKSPAKASTSKTATRTSAKK